MGAFGHTASQNSKTETADPELEHNEKAKVVILKKVTTYTLPDPAAELSSPQKKT